MAKEGRKQFQTGREIMRTYVPNYVPPVRGLEDQRFSVASGNEVAQVLLREFKKRIMEKKLRISPRRRA